VSYTYNANRQRASLAVQATPGQPKLNLTRQPLHEACQGKTMWRWNSFSATNAYDSLARRNSLSLSLQPSAISFSYAYDPASRLSGVTNGDLSASYSYLANSPLISDILFKQNGATRMTTTKQYHNLNRLTRISSVSSVQSVASFDYLYNDANQRTKVTLGPDNSYWQYQYDALGQVISGKKYWPDGTPVAGQ
jgi:YD repeat-containing protein